VVIAAIPFPITSSDDVERGILSKVSERTRIVVFDHVTSPTALVFPARALCQKLKDCRVDVLIDGAHAPGMLDLELETLGATFYAGNCHKWMCAPKGAGFLWVAPERQRDVVAPNISIGMTERFAGQSQFHAMFDWTGTADPTPFLTVTETIRFFTDLVEGGWDTVRAHNHGLALAARDILCETLGIDAPSPDDMIGSMAAFPIASTADIAGRLFSAHHIEVPVKPWSENASLLRISAQLYNRFEDYQRLASALAREGIRGATVRTSKA
jgi:isopenicillin-N epimerase